MANFAAKPHATPHQNRPGVKGDLVGGVRHAGGGAAAEAVCGKGLVEAGHPHKLAVKVWTNSRNPPDIKLFYRA